VGARVARIAASGFRITEQAPKKGKVFRNRINAAMVCRYAFGPFVLDAGRGLLVRDGEPVPAGRRALLVLQALLEARGKVVDKARLIAFGWPGVVVEESNLSVQVAALRKLLGPRPDGADWIVTVPRLGYRLDESSVVQDQASGPATAGPGGPAGSGLRPSVAVLPFTNLSADPAQEYFVDGITDDVIAALTRFRWFFVAGRSPSYAFKAREIDSKQAGRELGVRYLVRGSVRKDGGRVRIAVELTDAENGRCAWADHHDFDLTDVFAVQDQIARRVAASIEPELLRSETGTVAARPRGGTVTGWDLVARGCWFFHQVTQPTHLRARELFLQARQIDPGPPEAHLWLARVDAGLLAFGWAEDPARIQREGMQAALEAVRMDEKSCYAHYSLAIVSVMSDALDLALRAGEAAVEASPSFALGYLVLGMARFYSGDAAGAQAPLRQGLELNRHDPHNFVWYRLLALAELFAGQPEQALQTAGMALKVRPQWRPTMETMAACHAARGDAGAAREWLLQAGSQEPVAGDALHPLWRHNPGWAARMRAWLDDGR
jgi:TolB-like protein